MHALLSDVGALNNPYSIVAEILPLDRFISPCLGEMDTGDTRYRFFGMPVSVLNAGDEDDRLDICFRYPRSTLERAGHRPGKWLN
jgi:hypothetical protein